MALEKDIQVSLPDGITDAVILQPEGSGGPFPGALYLTDIGGIRPAQRQAAQRLSNEGYLVLLPNVFYRVSKPPVMDMALRGNPEAFGKRIAELSESLTPDALERDAAGYVDYLGSQDSVRDKNKLGVVGFCFSGGFGMRVAAARPNQIAACASFHGGHLYTDKPSSPHLLLPRIKAHLLFGHAMQDKSMPPEAIAAFEEALKHWGGGYESETYEGASHGWTTLDSPVYHPAQAARAYEKLKQLFSSTLS
jgi:carboxymethylenebutenolidase